MMVAGAGFSVSSEGRRLMLRRSASAGTPCWSATLITTATSSTRWSIVESTRAPALGEQRVHQLVEIAWRGGDHDLVVGLDRGHADRRELAGGQALERGVVHRFLDTDQLGLALGQLVAHALNGAGLVRDLETAGQLAIADLDALDRLRTGPGEKLGRVLDRSAQRLLGGARLGDAGLEPAQAPAHGLAPLALDLLGQRFQRLAGAGIGAGERGDIVQGHRPLLELL